MALALYIAGEHARGRGDRGARPPASARAKAAGQGSDRVSTRPIVPAEQEHGRGGVVGLVLFSPVVVGKWLLPE